MSDYQRSNFNREDPRLRSKSPTSRQSPSRDPRTRTTSTSSWDNQSTNHTGQFNQPQLQTSYQHLHYNNSSAQYPQNYYSGYENYYNTNPYQYNQADQQQQQYISGQGVQPGPPGEDYPQGGWAPVGGYNNQQGRSDEFRNSNDKSKAEGVVEELNKQKANLLKERETYEDRVEALYKKLKLLVDQKEQLSSKHSPNRETLHIIKENTKLQLEIQSKIKDANNVIEILSGLIGDKKKLEEEAMKTMKDDDSKGEKVNYKHYDPEIHWCRMCDVFPQSAKELLIHLHSKEHQDISQEEIPWHKLPPEPKFPVHEGAPVRRLPIKGLQFFVASTAWYCRLCDTWIGDLHCASQHLMSVTHSQNYSNFVEQNPHWEIEWLKDREKAVERIKRKSGSDTDDNKKKKKHKEKYSPSSATGKDKKKKKRSKRRRKHSSDSSSSSSSSSSSDDDDRDKSKSIRVAMRNKIKMFETDEKWDILGKLVEERKRLESKQHQSEKKESPKEDKLMSQWMTVSEPPVKERQLLDSLKEKLKIKQDAEKARLAAEYEAAQKIKEREEFERKQREKEKLHALEREEEEKLKERMSMKLKDVKFKGRDNYRRRNRSRSNSRSPDRNHHRQRSRSRSGERKSSNNGRRSFDASPNMRYSNEKDKDNDRRDHYKKEKKAPASYKKLPFIGRIPQFKNQKGKKPDEDKEIREIQKEDYDIPRKTRFQPGNLARAFIPEPEVVCFPKLSSYPPIAPPPPALSVPVPEPPKISLPKPPPPPKLMVEKEVVEVKSKKEKVVEPEKTPVPPPPPQDEYSMLYEDSSNSMMYSYGNMDYNMMYQQNQSLNFMQVMQSESGGEIPSAHKMPLQPPPLPPDDPNDDLALLGISSDDMAVQQMY